MTLMQFIGLIVLLHDIGDLGRLDRLHHWQIGAFLLVTG